MNFDVYSVEFGVYISENLTETLRTMACVYNALRREWSWGSGILRQGSSVRQWTVRELGEASEFNDWAEEDEPAVRMERKMQEGTKRIEFSWKPTEGVVSRGRDHAHGAKCSRWSDGRGRIGFHWTEQLGESWSPREDGLQRLEGSLSEGSFVPNTECNNVFGALNCKFRPQIKTDLWPGWVHKKNVFGKKGRTFLDKQWCREQGGRQSAETDVMGRPGPWALVEPALAELSAVGPLVRLGCSSCLGLQMRTEFPEPLSTCWLPCWLHTKVGGLMQLLWVSVFSLQNEAALGHLWPSGILRGLPRTNPLLMSSACLSFLEELWPPRASPSSKE